MTLQSVFDKYKHFDHLLSDWEWLTGPDEEGHRDIRMIILYDCWKALKEELSADMRFDFGNSYIIFYAKNNRAIEVKTKNHHTISVPDTFFEMFALGAKIHFDEDHEEEDSDV